MLPALTARLLPLPTAASAARAALRPGPALASAPIAALPALAGGCWAGGGRSAGRRLHTGPAAAQQAADLAKRPRCAARRGRSRLCTSWQASCGIRRA